MTRPINDRPESAVTSAAESLAKPRPYKVASVEKTNAPEGGQGQDWYRYILVSGRSTVTGQRRGSRKDVLAYAAQCAEQLNARGLTGQSIWSPRGRKPAAAASSSSTS